jgi:hypothetical protein
MLIIVNDLFNSSNINEEMNSLFIPNSKNYLNYLKSSNKLYLYSSNIEKNLLSTEKIKYFDINQINIQRIKDFDENIDIIITKQKKNPNLVTKTSPLTIESNTDITDLIKKKRTSVLEKSNMKSI